MKLSFLAPLYAQPGPYACAYVDTSRDIDDPDSAVELRRRHLRDELAAQGADPATVEALADVVGTDRDVPGRHGQAIFAAHGQLALVEELPEPPVHDRARYVTVPDALPLAAQHAPDIPYAAVVVRRADLRGETGAQQAALRVELESGRWPISSVAPGNRLHRRVPADEWQEAAAELVAELEALADRGGAEVIVVCGVVWARGVLIHHLPQRLRERVLTVEGDALAEDTGRALLERELGELFRDRMATHDRERIGRFLAERAREGGAAEGLSATVAALQRGQAGVLLLNRPAQFPRRLWAGPEPAQIALSAADLQSFGVSAVEEQPADAALIRAVVGTGAELVVVPQDDLPLDDGVGVLLRYADRATPS
ncbi:baeRF2 domain-containing protein [Streptomyces sp. KR80]|uniref:baeRF2 domain-containing protein n=1 Tax=Streptomyces sp. KR80 TaxID=3457426 RepID=UPI003FD07C69